MEVIRTAKPYESDKPSAPELDYVRQFISDATTLNTHQIDALALVMAVTHATEAFSTLPRVLALGEKGTGKSEVLEIADLLCANTMLAPAKQMTEPSIRSMFRMAAPDTMTLCADEISKMLGADGTKGETHPLYSLLLTGYKRKTAVSYRERNGVPDIVPTFGVVFASGIGKGAGDELRDRSIILKTEKLSDTDPKLAALADLSDPAIEAKGKAAQRALRSWVHSIIKRVEKNTKVVRDLHPKLGGRRAEVWGPLFCIAMEAGGDWLNRCALAFERIALGNAAPEITPVDQVVLDYADYAARNGTDRVQSGEFWRYCESLGRHIYADYASARGFGKGLAIPALGETSVWKESENTVRGWHGIEHKIIIRNAERLREEIARANEVHLTVPDEDENPYGDF
jgi:hypothetical protein